MSKLKLAIRSDTNKGVFVAYVADMKEEMMIPISALSLEIANKERKVFEAWLNGMENVMSEICKAALGVKPTHFERFTLGDKQ